MQSWYYSVTDSILLSLPVLHSPLLPENLLGFKFWQTISRIWTTSAAELLFSGTMRWPGSVTPERRCSGFHHLDISIILPSQTVTGLLMLSSSSSRSNVPVSPVSEVSTEPWWRWDLQTHHKSCARHLKSSPLSFWRLLCKVQIKAPTPWTSNRSCSWTPQEEFCCWNSPGLCLSADISSRYPKGKRRRPFLWTTSRQPETL